jgi:hypothetical protein
VVIDVDILSSRTCLVRLPTIRIIFEGSAIPAGTNRGRFVGVLQEPEEYLVGAVGGVPQNLIRQEVFTEILVVTGPAGLTG